MSAPTKEQREEMDKVVWAQKAKLVLIAICFALVYWKTGKLLP
jgi:preprotein translocase subunit SecE